MGAIFLGLLLLTLGALFIPFAAGATFAGAALLVAHQVIGDGGHTVHDVHDRTLRQTLPSPDLRARVDAGLRTLGQVATLIGAIGGGALATLLGAGYALVLSAALFASAAVVAYLRLVARRGAALNRRRSSARAPHVAQRAVSFWMRVANAFGVIGAGDIPCTKKRARMPVESSALTTSR